MYAERKENKEKSSEKRDNTQEEYPKNGWVKDELYMKLCLTRRLNGSFETSGGSYVKIKQPRMVENVKGY